MKSKTCIKCHTEKLLKEFNIRKDSKDGHRNTCKTCENIKSKNNRDNNIEKHREKEKKYREANPNKIKETHKNYRKNNKIKIKERDKKFSENNQEYIQEYRKEWNKTNLKNKRKGQIKYRKNNSKKISRRIKERKLIDPIFKLQKNISDSIRISIKRAGYNKKSKTTKILGCTFNEFKIYLESKFELWMNWNNHGKYKKDTFNFGWDLDHIIPISSAITYEDIIRLSHYTNFQPLCSKINRDVKKNKLF